MTPSKEATDEAFDAAAGRLLSSVAQERPGEGSVRMQSSSLFCFACAAQGI